MFIIKRDLTEELFESEKIVRRLRGVCEKINPVLTNVDCNLIANKTVDNMQSKTHTYQLDELSSQIAAYMSTTHPEYDSLAARITMSNIQKRAPKKFSEAISKLRNYIDPKTNLKGPLINENVYNITMQNADLIDSKIDHSRDFLFSYFGIKTLEKSYLKKLDSQIIETPQYMFMRVALGIHGSDLDKVFETYDLMSNHYYIPATPTLFNSGTLRPQLSSCFLLTMKSDSIEGIFDTVSQCAKISKSAGGIGLSAHTIRATGSNILGTGGKSNGIIPMLKVFNEVAKYVDQCFLGDTLITTDKGDKQIKNINPGDKVFTTGGIDSVVNKVVKQYDGTIRNIKINNRVTSVTECHHILSVCIKDGDLLTRLKMKIAAPEYRPASKLAVGDHIASVLQTDDSLYHNGLWYSKIQSIEDVHYTGDVYDLEIQSIHNYNVTDFGIAHNGGGLRKGAFAIYIEVWHLDIFDFLDLRKNTGSENHRARDLFYALWMNDEFMRRVQNDEDWTLMCPNEVPGLCDLYGEAFNIKYREYENNHSRRKVKARYLWSKIIDTQIETGMPYILYKDTCNEKSNQKNLGTIRNSNLCAEIVQYCSPDEVAVCNLSTIALPMLVVDNHFDFERLFEITQTVIKNLNKIIDINYYPVEEARNSNLRHRPVGLGVQGLADVFVKLRLPYESEQAADLNRKIFETIYYAAIDASVDLAKKEGRYSSFEGSPISQGKFTFDLYGDAKLSGMWDFDSLRQRVLKYGTRNSLLISMQPTASTASILGNTESFEPLTNNIYTRRVLSGEFVVINKYLFNDLKHVWNEELKNKIIANGGSVQGISEIPKDIQEIYKTVWEISQRKCIDLAADRQRFVCQSQSMNMYFSEPNFAKINAALMYGWKRGLKTGLYYLRSQPATKAQQFTVNRELKQQSSVSSESLVVEQKIPEPEVCYMKDGCMMCQ